MSGVVAVVSLLHQAIGAGSVQRSFRGESVLAWTLSRLAQAKRLSATRLICWEDQIPELRGIDVKLLVKGPRSACAKLDAISAARRWSDGWRGGLLGACHFDLGFDAKMVRRAIEEAGADAALLVDADAALVDPSLIDGLIEHAEAHSGVEYSFSSAAPGLSGIVLRAGLVDRLGQSNLHPGRLLNYYPDRPGLDPIGRAQCAPAPTLAVRTTDRFNLDSLRQIRRIEAATSDLNGELRHIEAPELVRRVGALGDEEAMPREVELEITTQRGTRALYRPDTQQGFGRGAMPLEMADRVFGELAEARFTFTGVGDPLLHPALPEMLRRARRAGVAAIHVESDLLPADPAALRELLECEIDVLSVHLPATSVGTYAKVMGIDALARVMENLGSLLRLKEESGRGTPLIVPTFVKCRENAHEMEAWYDYWLMALGSAVIGGPSDYCGLIADVAAADMSPPKRRPCRRLASRFSLLSDGTVVSCSQDVHGKQPAGKVGEDSLIEIWKGRFASLRLVHEQEQWGTLPLCGTCREWHRP